MDLTQLLTSFPNFWQLIIKFITRPQDFYNFALIYRPTLSVANACTEQKKEEFKTKRYVQHYIEYGTLPNGAKHGLCQIAASFDPNRPPYFYQKMHYDSGKITDVSIYGSPFAPIKLCEAAMNLQAEHIRYILYNNCFVCLDCVWDQYFPGQEQVNCTVYTLVHATEGIITFDPLG